MQLQSKHCGMSERQCIFLLSPTNVKRPKALPNESSLYRCSLIAHKEFHILGLPSWVMNYIYCHYRLSSQKFKYQNNMSTSTFCRLIFIIFVAEAMLNTEKTGQRGPGCGKGGQRRRGTFICQIE